MLYLLRYAEVGAEPHPQKSKLKEDLLQILRSQIQNPKFQFDFGRIFMGTEDEKAEEKLKLIHGLASFSPVVKCSVEELPEKFLLWSREILKGKKSFGIKVRRIGQHPFSSQEMAARLGEAVRAVMPDLKVDLSTPEEMLFVEIRGPECYLFNRIIPGLDRSPPPSPLTPLTSQKFIADDMLGKLAKRLRLLGLDVTYPKISADSLLLRLSREEGRTILTRDTGLVKVKGARAILIHSKKLSEQLQEVISALKLKLSPQQLFSRCAVCNGELQKIKKEQIKDRVPPLIYKIFDDFTYCPVCDKVYWKGTHFERILEELDQLK
jgi:hypothetical protein